MFEVARYVHPDIFVTNRGTGETFKFQVGSDGAITDQGIDFHDGDAAERRLPIWLEEGKPRKLCRSSY